MKKSFVRYFSWTLTVLVLWGGILGKSMGKEIGENQQIPPSYPQVDYRPIQSVDEVARSLVLQAYVVMQQKQWYLLPLYTDSAQKDHELGAYPMYWYLRYQLTQKNTPLPTKALQRFVHQYANTYLAERLKADWLVSAVKRGDFSTASRLGLINVNNAPAQCAYYHAQVVMKKSIDINKALAGIVNHERCWELLVSLKNYQLITLSHLQLPLREAVEYDDKVKAKHYARIYFTDTDFQQFIVMMKDPKQWLATQSGQGITSAQKELRALAFSRLARQNRDEGFLILERRGKELLNPADVRWAYSQFALISALNLESRADKWYRKAGNSQLSNYNAAWRVRIALRQPKINWLWVSTAINLMDKQQQQEPAWVYWKARAFKALGKETQANALFKILDKHHDFYGQLAQEELYGRVQRPPEPTVVTSQELAHIKQNTGLQRAVALFRLGWRKEAVGEWTYAIAGLNDRDLLAAAQWAYEEQIFDRVINTSMLTKQQVSLQQRFITPFGKKLIEKLQKVSVDPAWVYGLIRQESRFVTEARSGTGASGLMQIMPATAKLVARKLGLQNFSVNQLYDVDTNILLGISYLKMILDDLGNNEILATAGYNAGPLRAKRWRATLTKPIEGAIFAETIPFTETRHYVKHVLSNTIWYDGVSTHGRIPSLKQRLGMVSPAK